MTTRERAVKLGKELSVLMYGTDKLEWYASLLDAMERNFAEAVDESVKNTIAAQRTKPIGYGEIVISAEVYARHILDTRADEREACAQVATTQQAFHDSSCRASCKCADGYHIAMFIRARKVTP